MTSSPSRRGASRNALFDLDRRKVRLSTLVALRWMAVFGQTLTVLFVALVMGFQLPLAGVLTVIAAAVWVNLLYSGEAGSARELSDIEVSAQLSFDVLQLSALLLLTGGLANPFVVLLSAPVVIGFTVLARPYALAIAALAFSGTLVMWFWSMPLPWAPAGEFDAPPLYRAGLWLAFLVAATFMSLFVWRVAEDARRMSAALAATQEVLAREQRLSALGGLAAAAAHELGTPLGTIQLVAREMETAAPAGSVLAEDAALLVTQAKRCRDILSRLGKRGEEGDAVHDTLSLRDLLDEVITPMRDGHVAIETVLETPDGAASLRIRSPRMVRIPELIFALRNILANALDYATSGVRVHGYWDQTRLRITITDDGPGFAHEILQRLGEPYVSARDPSRQLTGGLGLGVFIARLFIERSGGTVRFANRNAPHAGAEVIAEWPLKALIANDQGNATVSPSPN
jgi:two-component system, sensor histidine kinase RegB